MPYNLPLDQALRQAGWKVKIYDAERLEPPHVTILRKFEATWRLSLRDGGFLDDDQKWSQIDKQVREAIEANWEMLVAEWDAMHPDNPVQSNDDA